eukprot:TRINITY_DN1351_c0_g1_i1.p1 TRINITY_DN1351_c0_g1~~TRINITY_DN1351_c0_g1_i1.p1  ORF type:complete len:835 (-),score=150.14 TRINITY_DN1351_c0_g1_i1:6-2510(-)
MNGGRLGSAVFNWTVVSPAANFSLSALGAAFWAIPAALLVPGTTYVFGLQVTNFLGQSSLLTTKTIEKSGFDVPQLFGPSSVVLDAQQTPVYLLQYSASLPQCALTTSDWTYVWSFASGSATFNLDTATQHTLALFLNASVLSIGQDYTLVLTAASASLSLSVSANVAVQRSGAPLVVVLSAPATVAPDGQLVLDASASFDPDEGTAVGTVAFRWTCNLCSGDVLSSCTQPCVGFSDPQTAVLSLSASALIASRVYAFSVNFTKGARFVSERRLVAVLAPSASVVNVVLEQTDVLGQNTKTTDVGIDSSVCATVNPAVEIILRASSASALQGLQWDFQARNSETRDREVPIAVQQNAILIGIRENTVLISSATLSEWQGYTWRISTLMKQLSIELGSTTVCFVVGVAPQVQTATVSQVEDKLRYSVVMANRTQSADFLIGYRTQPSAARNFLSFSQASPRAGNVQRFYQTSVALAYSYTLVQGNNVLPPCPSAETFPFIFVCRQSICVELLFDISLDCSNLGRAASQKIAISDCTSQSNPLDQVLCAVHVAQAVRTAAATDASLSLLQAAAQNIRVSTPGTLLLLSAHHAAITAAAPSSKLDVLMLLLRNRAYALAQTTPLLFSSLADQTARQCTASVDDVLSLFEQKSLETTVCGGTHAYFTSNDLAAAALKAVVSASGEVSMASLGTSVTNLTFRWDQGEVGACESVAASLRVPDCSIEDPKLIISLTASGLRELSFRTAVEGDCAAWDDNAGIWSRNKCSRSGNTCSCEAASKVAVLPVLQPICCGPGGGINAAAVAGGLVGALVGVGAGVGAFLWWRKKREAGGRDVEMR